MARKPKPRIRPPHRPRYGIDWDWVADQLKKQCTGIEIAATIGICADTLYKACERDLGLTFSEFTQKNRAAGVQRARSSFYDYCWSGDPADKDPKSVTTSRIFWLKNHADMTDKNELRASVQATVQHVIELPSNQSGPVEQIAPAPKPWELP